MSLASVGGRNWNSKGLQRYFISIQVRDKILTGFHVTGSHTWPHDPVAILSYICRRNRRSVQMKQPIAFKIYLSTHLRLFCHSWGKGVCFGFLFNPHILTLVDAQPGDMVVQSVVLLGEWHGRLRGCRDWPNAVPRVPKSTSCISASRDAVLGSLRRVMVLRIEG